MASLRSLYIPPRVAAWIPGTSRQFGPPRRVGLIRDVVPRQGGRVWPIVNRQIVPRPQPRIYGPAPRDLHADWPQRSVPASVFELPEARLLGPHVCLVTANDTILLDHCFWGWTQPPRPAMNEIYQRKKAQPLRRIEGRVLSLGTDFGVGSFGHLVHDGLVRLQLVLAAGFQLKDFDWIYLPRPDTPAVRDLEALLAFPREKILNWTGDLAVAPVVSTSFAGEVGRISVEGASFIRDRAQAQWGGGRRRRIYLSRRGYSRTLSNDDEITAILAEHGFETVDPGRDPGVLEACANAEIIAGVDGSNLANLAFAPAGAHTLNFLPPGTTPVPYHTSLSISGSRRLSLLVGTDSVDPARPYTSNFRLPPERLRQALAEVG